METNKQPIEIGDRVFFYERIGTDEMTSGFGMVIDKTSSFISEKYGTMLGVTDEGENSFDILIVLHDGDGVVEEHLSKDCVKQEQW